MDRIFEIRTKMERHYGKGLVGMFDPETGKFDPNRLGWAKHGRKLGGSITVQLGDLTFDASTGTAFLLGASKGLQWDGLSKGDAFKDSVLSNCFAATYASLEGIDLMFYDYETISDVEGTWKGFDVFVSGPIKAMADNVVVYEMCELNNIMDQAKLMSSLDWASISDNLVRESMVLIVESPNSFELMGQIMDTAKCAAKVAEDYKTMLDEIQK